MEFSEVVKQRRALRYLDKITVTNSMISYLTETASLAPSCYNNQPWRYVFVRNSKLIDQICGNMPDGNSWAKSGSMIVAVHTEKQDDCVIHGREYYLFDTGISAGFLMLAAQEIGLVAHPIAGYKEKSVKEILDISKEQTLIALIIVGKKTESFPEGISEEEKRTELNRPPRKAMADFIKIID
ncbi:MAG: nitroreductase family protein [Candidatus Cloacimonetes bacterium]|nr:nitroreductase family protein [Candidatus Cloacimonadota bacterium]